MKKLLLIIISLLCILCISCKNKDNTSDDNIINTNEDTKVHEVVNVNGSHEYSFLDDNITSYMIYKAKPSSIGFLQSLTFYSHILKNKITDRKYQYYQVDYIFDNNERKTYYHIFDYIDYDTRNYIQNFLPYNNQNKELINELNVLIEYSYNLDNANIEKAVTYQEKILKFDINEFNNNLNTINDLTLSFYKVEELKYKLYFTFDDEKYNSGHFDVQTFVKIGDNYYPLFGLYQYGIENGNYTTVSSLVFEEGFIPSRIYWKIEYYDINGNNNEFYYQEEVK